MTEGGRQLLVGTAGYYVIIFFCIWLGKDPATAVPVLLIAGALAWLFKD